MKNDGVDTLKNDNDIMPFKNLFNEFQSKETSRKIKAVRQANAKAGNYLGAYVPYGYMASPDDKHKFMTLRLKMSENCFVIAVWDTATAKLHFFAAHKNGCRNLKG